MITKFNGYIKEELNIRDAMKPKELSGDDKIVGDAFAILSSFNLEPELHKKRYGAFTISIEGINYLYMTIRYNTPEHIEHLKGEYEENLELGWELYYHDKRTDSDFKRSTDRFFDDWDDLLKRILEICYPDIDKELKEVNDRIRKLNNTLVMENNIKDQLIKIKTHQNDN